MKLLGGVWNDLPQHERMTLLRYCKTVMAESIKEYESTLTWDELWPMRQDELCDVDAPPEPLGRRKGIGSHDRLKSSGMNSLRFAAAKKPGLLSIVDVCPVEAILHRKFKAPTAEKERP